MTTNQLDQKLIECLKNKEKLSKDFSISDHFLSSYWEKQIQLYSELEEACKLIKMRSISEEMLNNLGNIKIYEAPDITLWNDQKLPFYYVRHICFSGYIILTWNIYDRLTSFYVRIMSPDGIMAPDKKQIPSLQKLFENKDVKKKFSAFGSSEIAGKFLPYIQISYKIRNTLAHEGHCDGDIPLFEDNKTPKYAFLPNEKFLEILSSSIIFEDSAMKEEVKNCSDLRTILFRCNSKIDMLLASLVSHASDCFCAHLKAWANQSDFL